MFKSETDDDFSAPTRQDEVYLRLRKWLTTGLFLPGQRLKIRQIATMLDAGQMPVRAALQRLAAEGALVNVPNAGVTVPMLSVPEFDDLLQMRLLLEGEAAERGALMLGRDELERLSNLCARMGRSLAAGDHATYLADNEEFHLVIYRRSGSALLLQLIDTVWLKAGPVSNQLFEAPGAPQVLNHAHELLLKALLDRDAFSARRAVEQDIFVAAQFLRRKIRQSQVNPVPMSP